MWVEWASRRGGRLLEINERNSTVTCSVCLQKTGPCGLSGLGIREWSCPSGVVHDRDVNAATNILRLGRETLSLGRIA
ncbi:MAG TPA: zinc ribbon domain-containing protein [Oligoflexus sp.]|uniref:zinc ribbon domain-containing protein n=1 Tax=Oligoflexus sp. TaxID=1971216 RepID=UPI002D6760F7|nr:zinc ribbon domain-containing protein [Oligoflexus sp.]HYX33868.1 zinc ribbon domain-containing protein [Oligoflexus sp.]